MITILLRVTRIFHDQTNSNFKNCLQNEKKKVAKPIQQPFVKAKSFHETFAIST